MKMFYRIRHVLIGKENEAWYHLPVDQVEWTNPKYFHQN